MKKTTYDMKQKLRFAAVLVALLVAVPFGSGAQTPTQINSVEGLNGMTANGNYIITGDISDS